MLSKNKSPRNFTAKFCKTFKEIINSTQFLSANRREPLQLVCGANITLIIARHIHYKKRKLYPNSPNECRCRNLENISKSNKHHIEIIIYCDQEYPRNVWLVKIHKSVNTTSQIKWLKKREQMFTKSIWQNLKPTYVKNTKLEILGI